MSQRTILTSVLFTVVVMGVTYGFISCENTSLTLTRVNAAITMYDDHKMQKSYEFLSMWLTFGAAENVEDIASIYIINDELELHWNLESGQWISVYENSDMILLSRLRMHNFSSIPRGEYRVIVQNYAGDESIKKAYISPRLSIELQNIPRIIVQGGKRTFRTPFTLNYVFGINEEGKPYNIQKLNNMSIIDAAMQQTYNQMYFFAPTERQAGYLLGPY